LTQIHIELKKEINEIIFSNRRRVYGCVRLW